MTQNNLELMRTLDESWNAQDWQTFEKRHSSYTIIPIKSCSKNVR